MREITKLLVEVLSQKGTDLSQGNFGTSLKQLGREARDIVSLIVGAKYIVELGGNTTTLRG